jgi:hydrogenase maturation protease
VLTIIGCGNPARGDDGLGPAVAQRLRAYVAASGREDVRVLDAGTDGMGVMFAARGSDTLVIVDAARTGEAPGAVFEVPGDVLSRDYAPSLTLHDFRWDHALAAGKQIFANDFPATVTVLLAEVQSTEFGLELSPAMRAAADVVCARIEALIATYPEVPFRFRGGRLYIDAAVFAHALAGRETIALLRQGDDLHIIPLRDATLGGYLCKRRTSAGDRVVHAEDFFRDYGLDETHERSLRAHWQPEFAALVARGFFEPPA